MTLKDITILKSIAPITILDKPSKQTIEYLAKIIQEPKFNDFLEALHLQCNFPKEGISIKNFVGMNFNELPVISNRLIRLSLENATHELCKSIGISDEFNTPMLLLFFFNAFIDIDYFEGFITEPIKFILGRKNIASSMFDYTHEVGAIIIPFNMSQNTLLKWVKNKKNWSNIQKQMDDNLTTDPYLLRLHLNTEIALEIVDMKDNKGMSYFNIANELAKTYPNDIRVKDGEWIKKTYKDYKQLWNSLPHKDKSLNY